MTTIYLQVTVDELGAGLALPPHRLAERLAEYLGDGFPEVARVQDVSTEDTPVLYLRPDKPDHLTPDEVEQGLRVRHTNPDLADWRGQVETCPPRKARRGELGRFLGGTPADPEAYVVWEAGRTPSGMLPVSGWYPLTALRRETKLNRSLLRPEPLRADRGE